MARPYLNLPPKHWAMIGAGLALAALLVAAFLPKRVAVDVATVATGPMRVTVDEEGKTRIKDVYVVSAPVAGRMLRSPFDEGDAVTAGNSVVAVIQPAAPPFLDARARKDAEAQVKAAAAAVELAAAEARQAAAELKFAERDLERARSLGQTGVVAARGVEKATLEVETRKAATAKAEAAIEVRRRELDGAQARAMMPSDATESGRTAVAGHPSCCVEVRAPVNGRILKIVARSEQVIAVGAPLVEIGDTQDLEVVVELLSTDAVKIASGARATVEGWGGGTALAAKVRRIEPAAFTKVSALGIDEQRVRVVLDLAGSAAEWIALGHDYRVLVRIVAWEQPNALRVPIGALFRSGERWSVFKAGAGRAVRTAVEIGHRNGEHAEILAGLAAGDRIVLHPSDRVLDRTRITERVAEKQ